MLSAKISFKSDVILTIEYQFHNDRSAALFVFNLINRTNSAGDQTADPSLAYIVPDGPDSAIIGKYLGAIPSGMKVEAPEVPFLVQLPPGKQLAGVIVARVPLAAHRAYIASPVSRDPNGMADRLSVQIGFLDSSRFAKDMAVVEPAVGHHGMFVCDYGLGLELQEFAAADLALHGESVATFFV